MTIEGLGVPGQLTPVPRFLLQVAYGCSLSHGAHRENIATIDPGLSAAVLFE